MKKNTKFIISTLFLSFLGLSALTALAATAKNFKDLVENTLIKGILNPVVPFIIGLAVVVFIYGVLLFMFNEGGEKKEDGKKYMFWGIVGIFVMVSVWGLVNILIGTFGLDQSVPTVKMDVPRR